MELMGLMGSLVEVIPQRLRSISPEKAAEKPAPGKWSEKEELGHLLDSAANNHQRMVRTQLEDSPALPGYTQDQWVALHRYQERGWGELIEIWETLNRQLLAAAEAASPEQRQRTCSVAGSGPLTLSFVFDDYVRHMLHHLAHLGVQVEDVQAPPVTT
jgi:hypothetical protein